MLFDGINNFSYFHCILLTNYSQVRNNLFIKLPDWFKIEAPISDYNPDWAIITDKHNLQKQRGPRKIFLV